MEVNVMVFLMLGFSSDWRDRASRSRAGIGIADD
jgi:hypothetical protein